METPGGILQWEGGCRGTKASGGLNPTPVPSVNPVANQTPNNNFPENPGRCDRTP